MRQRKTFQALAAVAVCAGLVSAAMAEGTATVKATVKKGGERCKRTVVKMDADPYCAKAHEKKVGSETCIVSKDGEVKNAIVYVKDGLGDASFPVPEETKTLDQQGCMYVPHVMTVQTEQKVVIKNSDETLHNIHSFAEKQRQFNFAQPQKDMTKEVTFSRPEFVKVKCDVHPWMSAIVGVFNHPFHNVTAEDGTTRLEKLPAGEYTIAVWHEELGELEQKVTIADGETKEITFELP